jgi:hypothetical protein
MNSGAIIDIDFSTVPAAELNLGASAQSNSNVSEEGDDTEVDSEAGVQLDSRIDIDGEAVDAKLQGAVRSGLRL